MVKDPVAANTFAYSNFPLLQTDSYYKPTSEPTDRYNCIAWAMRLTDRWVDLAIASGHWWPCYHTGFYDHTPDGLITAFEALKFKKCNNGRTRYFYDKVALYSNSYTGRWTHAARILSDEEYHSKFGNGWDAHHGEGDVLHNKSKPDKSYGHVYQYMARPKIYRVVSYWQMIKFIAKDIYNLCRY